MKATKKPIQIDYFPCEPEFIDAIYDWHTPEINIRVHFKNPDPYTRDFHFIEISTSEGVVKATEDDVIIRGVNGEVYPCKKDIFEETYSVISEE